MALMPDEARNLMKLSRRVSGIVAVTAALLITGCATGAQKDAALGEWHAVNVPTGAPGELSNATLSISESNMVASVGCNTLDASYSVTFTGALRVSPGPSTERGCTSPGVTQAEEILFSSLDDVKVQEAQLVIATEYGDLTFESES